MAMPSNSSNTLDTRWKGIKDTNGRIKNQCDSLIAKVSVTRKEALDLSNRLADSLSALDTLTANAVTSGLLTYAQEQESDTALDIPSAYTTMRAQVVATQDWLVANFPKDAAGNLVVYAFDVNKRFADVALTPGQLSAFKTQLNALSTTIA